MIIILRCFKKERFWKGVSLAEKGGPAIIKEKKGRWEAMIRLLIIADDFTGALDTGVQFAACGVSTRVITDRTASLQKYAQACEVLVIDAETRHLTAGEAYAAVKTIVLQAIRLKIPHIYKKTDSALRGNVGAELTALLEASAEPLLPFLPAFPQMGRNTIGGIHYIGDTPVAESVFGADPFEPVIHSRVSELIGQQSGVEVHSCPCLADGEAMPEGAGILVFDAASVEDLTRTGRRLLQEGKLKIMAGCAGFGAVLPALLKLGTGVPAPMPELDPHFLVICGSVNPITTAQADRAEQEGFLRLRLAPEQKLNPEYWNTSAGEQALRSVRNALGDCRCRIIDTNDFGGNQETADYAARHGMTTGDVRQAVSRSIGYLVSHLFGDPNLGTLLITGGDTLLQCMGYMGIQEIEPLCEMDSGVVLSRFTYQGFTRYVISKSGGFGKQDLLIDLANRIVGSPIHKMEENV